MQNDAGLYRITVTGYVIDGTWLRVMYHLRGSHIADTHREDMVHIIYSIAYCDIKLHNCPPLLLGPFRLPPGSVLTLKEDQPFQSPFPATFRKVAIAE